MGLPENEVVADNQRRTMEEASKSPVDGVIGNVISVARPALAVGLAVVASGATATGLVVAGGIVGGLGIVDWFRRLGNSKVNENLESLGQATEEALCRVEDTLRKHGTSIDEIKARIESQEFKDGMASASLQALRTTQKDRLNRMALILANGMKENDLNSESFDDMMRAAAELKDTDISMLGKLYQLWKPLLDRTDRSKHSTSSSPNFHSEFQNIWHNFGRSLNPAEQFEYRGSFARLQSHGMIQQVTFSNSELGRETYVLLEDGARFHERLQEIAVQK
jgi:DNA-binding transcriptional MerR regulator